MDNYKNAPQYLYGLSPSQIDMFKTKDNPIRQQSENVTEIVLAVTELLVAQFIWLDYDNPSMPIYLYINSSGTQAYFVTNMEPIKFWEFGSLVLEGLGYERYFLSMSLLLVKCMLVKNAANFCFCYPWRMMRKTFVFVLCYFDF